ncbi:GntR family transcriptional regulator [Sporomusa sp.]|uniref:GntR family transcriptional regulator n=1 Tax=Sporomusa sp. TaxID=2078658 RepID=UPI002C2E0C1D|nr:GntR family transcriptional regulator [Sporomusa sp.]HWR42957.1 GntR family transcriptional regulator [Sporomusa sp.]
MQYNDQLMPLKEQALNEGEVYPVLRRAIVGLYLQPGAVLSIKDICEHFEMGRSPVRDALMRLDQEGLVTLLPQRGTMISRIDYSRVEQERFLRLAVEEEVMKLFMACHTPSDITLLHEALRQQQELCDQKELDTRRFLWLDDEFHQVFYTVADKLFCLQAIQNVGGHYRRMRLLTCGDRTSMQEILRQHSALLTALQARDTELMCNIFHYHLRRLDREERLVVKKYPYLFNSGTNHESPSPLWKADYLQTLKTKGE